MRVALPAGWAAEADIDPGTILGAGIEIVEYRPAAILDARTVRWDSIEGIVPIIGPITDQVMAKLPQLRVISVPGTGVWDSIDVSAATRRGIVVCNVRDYAADSVADFTVGLMLALSRHVFVADRSVREGLWGPSDFVATDLRDKTLGIIGFGSVGRRVAELGHAFGMAVVCSTPHPDPEFERAQGVAFVSLDVLLELSHVISLHARLTERTRRLIGRRQLSRVQTGTLLINTARGGLVDETALAEALSEGRLGGAALDVFDEEPLPLHSPLRHLRNVILTPHIGAATHRAIKESVRRCLENIVSFQIGQPRNVVNPEALAVL